MTPAAATRDLEDEDLAMFARIRVPAEAAGRAGVRRVTHDEARTICGIRYNSHHLEGIAFPYFAPWNGNHLLTWRVRRDRPEVDSSGKPIAKYVSPPERKHLYFGPDSQAALKDPTVPAVIVEAEKSVLAIAASAERANRTVPLLLATGGCWGWRGTTGKGSLPNGERVDEKGTLADFDHVVWARRDAFIVFDSNIATNPSVAVARQALAKELTRRGARVRLVDLPVEQGINGPDDYIGAFGDDAFWKLIAQARDAREPTSPRKTASQASVVVDLATGAGAELWHTRSGDAYISIDCRGHREHHALNSRASRDYLTQLYYSATKRTLNGSALQDALGTLSGVARFEGDQHDVYVRIAGEEQRITLDVGDVDWRVVEISSEGWRVVATPAVRFRRPRGLLPLPLPQPGGSINQLRPFLNVGSNPDFILIVAWLLAALRGCGPYPILVEQAEQGSAKTTTMRVLRRIVDPNESDVRRPPRNTEDLMIAATNGHVVALDNLSRLAEDLSDTLATLATGGGFAVRRLYTNDEEHIFRASKPIILNGISQVVTRGDLLERAITVTLPPIADSERKDEATFWREFDQRLPYILGALLDAVVGGLRHLPDVSLARKPRMADFAMWSVATEFGCPWPPGTFMAAYAGNQERAVDGLVEGDVLAEFVQQRAPWTGTASELLDLLNSATPESIRKQKGWFTKPRQVGDHLRSLAPALRRTGVDVSIGEKREPRTGRRLIVISRNGCREALRDSSPSSPSSPYPESGWDCRWSPTEPAPSVTPMSVANAGITGAGDDGDRSDDAGMPSDPAQPDEEIL